MKRFVLVAAVIVCTSSGFADQLVNPETVAPEFRAAAEKRRAEQLKLLTCHRRALEAKVPVRDQTTFVARCYDAATKTD